MDALKKLNQDWLNAIAKKDALTLGSILIDDFIMVSTAGKKLTKQDNPIDDISPGHEIYINSD